MNRIKGNVKVYFVKRYTNQRWGYNYENTYESLMAGEIAWVPDGDMLRYKWPFEVMITENEVWNNETKTTDYSTGALGWFYTSGNKKEQFQDTGINDRQSKDQ